MSQKLDAEFLGKPQMDYEVDHETWTALLSSLCGLDRPQGIQPATFTGSAHTEKFCGLDAIDISGNAYRVERTGRDVRLDGIDSYFATLQLDGQSTLGHNDQIINLAAGDIVLYDNAHPATWVSEGRRGRWFSFALPRQQLISHLGFEPEGGLYAHGARLPARLLLRLVLDAVDERESAPASAEPYMQLAIYDLLGALFTANAAPSVSAHSDKLFRRACSVIKDGLANPDLRLSDVAAKVGISLRYLHKLFTQRGSTCSEFIYSLRLDHAARLICRRDTLRSGRPLSEIAYACGFLDYTHFARKFRYRFGHPPGAHSPKNGRTGDVTVRSDAGERTPSAQDGESPLI
jgi:AraC family transcriptional regulator, positive regulator of tynA and feaB